MKRWFKRIAVALTLLLLASAGGVAYLGHLLTSRVPGESFESAGFPIHYTDEGSGEAVILIHGLAAHSDLNWRRAGITGMLAKEFRVLSFDLRGHGLSGRSTNPDDYGHEMSEDVVRLMDHLGIERAHIAGYSLGGFIALKVASDHPDRIASAAYCASGWKDPNGPEELLRPYRLAPARAASFVHGGVEYRMAYAGGNDGLIWGPIDWAKDWIGGSLADKGSIKAMKKNYSGLLVTQEDLAAMTVPSICFMGTNDGLKPYADDFKANLPALEYVVLDGSNHITLIMRPEFKQGLRDFFRAHAIHPDGPVASAPNPAE